MRHRRPLRTAVSAILLASGLVAGGAAAQASGDEWKPRSGDAWVDAWLGDINRYAARYRDPFIDEVVRFHGAPRGLVASLLERGWPAGDVYFACALAQVIGRPCGYVVDVWQANRSDGWGKVARGLGVAPGSPGFQRVKRGIVPSYDRWSRPITLDEELRRTRVNPGTPANAQP